MTGNRIIEILLKLKSDLKGATEVSEAIDKASRSAEDSSKKAGDAAEKERAAFAEAAKAAQNVGEAAAEAGKKAVEAAAEATTKTEEQRGAVDTLPPEYEKAGEAAADAGKKAKNAADKFEDAANKAPTHGRKVKVLGDVLRHIANLNFSAAVNSLRQLGTVMDAFVGTAAVAVTAIIIWLKNIRDWIRAADDVKKADLSNMWQNTASSIDAAAESFDRLRLRAAAAWNEVLQDREVEDAYLAASRRLSRREMEADRDRQLAAASDPEEKRAIQAAYDKNIKEMELKWEVADTSTAIERNKRDAEQKRAEAQAARDRIAQNRAADAAIARDQKTQTEAIGEIEDQSLVTKIFANIFRQSTIEDRIKPYQKNFDEGAARRDALLKDSREALAEAKRLDAEADRISGIERDTLRLDSRAATGALDSHRTIQQENWRRSLPSNQPPASAATASDAAGAVNNLAAASTASNGEVLAALRSATEQIKRQQGEIAQLKEQIKNLPLD